ncbi:hypothetical protein ACFV5G_10975 [Streptomyces sp. NPDC059766]|uniref:hypothetical protein n=1 Tax=Streptomyces sp. NPDC059766 TaxID=3346940 RepID=UPI0036642825
MEALAALAATLRQGRTVATDKAFAILEGTLLSIDRVVADRAGWLAGGGDVKASLTSASCKGILDM